MAKPKRPSVEEIIQRTVAATRIATEREARDTFKATEKRLYAYPVIKLKIKNDRERIEEIQDYGAPTSSKSIVRFQRSGSRMDAEEIAEALITDLRADIARNECELETIDRAILVIDSDPYAGIVKHKYFEGKTDEEIAGIMNCDPRTVRRQKSRLVGRLAVFLYGVTAVT